MKRHLLFILLSIPAIGEVSAQGLYPVSLDKKISNSELIVEGKVTDQTSFWNPQHTLIFTSNTVEIYKIFKGTINSTTIEIMTEGGNIGNVSITVSELLKLRKGEIGIFFCYPNQINLRSPLNNELLYAAYSSSQGFYKYNPFTLAANAPFTGISDVENNLYKAIEEKTGQPFRSIRPFTIASLHNSSRPDAVSITSFTPTTVNAGATIDVANNELTINGSGFGTASGIATVFFDDADDGPGNNLVGVAFDDPLMVSWTATQIKVKVPSNAGTGTIIVQDDAGNTGASGSALNVNYSVLTGTFSFMGTTVTKEANLMNTDGSGGYTVHYSTSTAGGGVDLDAAPEKATFQRALATWKEITGFNVTEGATTASQSVSNDGFNTIMFDNTNTGKPPLDDGVLGICYFFAQMCTPLATNAAQRTGFDIIIRNAGVSIGSANFTLGPCPPASSSFMDLDLETVLLHELGHALGLGHINDGLEGASLPNINPGKLMNFSLVNGVKRSTPDNSAYAGALYIITPQSNTYGSCGLFASEMSPLSTTTESKDECPSFPSVALPGGTVITYDLVHATSNKNTDPQYTALKCTGTGTGVTNTAFYAFKTAAAGGGTLLLTVSGYGTTPAAQSSCTPVAPYSAAAGVELALYAVSSCPAGQSFPAPVACRTFNGNGALTSITGLSASATYLLVADGIENTKASFSLTFGGNVLPVNLLSFTGEKIGFSALLKWQTASEFNNDHFEIETSKDGINFYQIGTVRSLGNSTTIQSYDFNDNLPVSGANYYRLKQVDKDQRVTYSKIVTIIFDNRKTPLVIYPNPANDELTIDFAMPSQNVIVSIFSPDGRIVKKEALGFVQRTKTINVSILRAGAYLLRITTADNTYNTGFIKQ